MTWYTKLVMTMASVICCFTCATIFLLYQYKLGIPYSFPVSLAFAAALAIVVPLGAVALVDRIFQKSTGIHLFGVFCAVSILIALGFGAVTF